MPCPHNEITIVQRSQRQSAVAAAAYQSGEKLFCEYDQQVKHYPEKRGIVHNEILLPANAPQKYADRNTLWNAAEAVEKQWNSQLARRWVLTIPREIPPDQYAVLVREFCKQQFVSKGMVADFAIHDPHPPGHNMMNVKGEAKGYYHQTEKYIAVKEGMSNAQKMKTGVHEVSHALLHDREVMDAEGVLKDQTTKEVEVESIAYIVCNHFGLDTSEYSFTYIASCLNGFVSPGVKARMEAAKFILNVEVICRAAGIFFVLVVNQLFLKDCMNVPLQNRSIWIFRF